MIFLLFKIILLTHTYKFYNQNLIQVVDMYECSIKEKY